MTEPNTLTSTDDWAAKATTTVVGYVDKVRSATTGKALVISRLAVYGLAMALLAIILGILLLIFLVRAMVALTALLPFIEDGQVWLAYLILGVLFSAGGMFLWSKKGA